MKKNTTIHTQNLILVSPLHNIDMFEKNEDQEDIPAKDKQEQA